MPGDAVWLSLGNMRTPSGLAGSIAAARHSETNANGNNVCAIANKQAKEIIRYRVTSRIALSILKMQKHC